MTREQYDYLKIGARVKLERRFSTVIEPGTIGIVLETRVFVSPSVLVKFHGFPNKILSWENYSVLEILDD